MLCAVILLCLCVTGSVGQQSGFPRNKLPDIPYEKYILFCRRSQGQFGNSFPSVVNVVGGVRFWQTFFMQMQKIPGGALRQNTTEVPVIFVGDLWEKGGKTL